MSDRDPTSSATLAAAEPRDGVPTGEPNAFVTSPFVGTFYLAARPDEPPYVKVGDLVHAGQTLCVIEAMKLYNEILSEMDCLIEEILVVNQQPVEFGTMLFRVRTL